MDFSYEDTQKLVYTERDALLKVHLTLDGNKVIYSRKVFGLFDYIGALGGSFALITAFWGMFVGDLPKNIFFVKAVSKLLLVWPYDNKILKAPNPNPKSQSEALSQYKIKQRKRCMFYCYNRCPMFRVFESKSDQIVIDTMNRIMAEGSERVDRLFDVIKIIKNLRDTKHVVIHYLNRANDGNNKDKFNG